MLEAVLWRLCIIAGKSGIIANYLPEIAICASAFLRWKRYAQLAIFKKRDQNPRGRALSMSGPASERRMEELLNLAFKREVIRKVTDVVVPLNDAGFGPPFYCVHGILGAST